MYDINLFTFHIIKQHYSFDYMYCIYIKGSKGKYIGKNVFQLHYKCVTAKFILESSASKRNPQRRQDIAESALLETYHVRAAQ